MASAENFPDVYDALRQLMIPFADRLDIVKDQPDTLYLNTRHIMKNKQPLYFGGIQINKRYVSYHLMPVYVNPALLDDISDGLRKRMQGKSCLNFVSIEPDLFDELRELTQAGFNFYEHEGYI